MPRKSRLKCYFGCRNDGPLHSLPNPTTYKMDSIERFEQWKAVLEEATQKKGNMYIYYHVRLCDDHFLDCYKLPSRRLTQNAVPTLHLAKQMPEVDSKKEQHTYIRVKILSPDSENEQFSRSDITTIELTEQQELTPYVRLSTPESAVPAQTSTSTATNNVIQQHELTPYVRLSTPESAVPTQTSTSTATNNVILHELTPYVRLSTPESAVPQTSTSTTTNNVIQQHELTPYVRLSTPESAVPTQTFISTATNKVIRTQKHSSPEVPSLQLVNKLQRKLERITTKYKDLRKQMRKDKKIAINKAFSSIIDKLPEHARIFTKLQIKSVVKPRGRRFSEQEKLMAQKILKKSPEAYKLFQEMFVLPSKRTLRDVKIP